MNSLEQAEGRVGLLGCPGTSRASPGSRRGSGRAGVAETPPRGEEATKDGLKGLGPPGPRGLGRGAAGRWFWRAWSPRVLGDVASALPSPQLRPGAPRLGYFCFFIH